MGGMNPLEGMLNAQQMQNFNNSLIREFQQNALQEQQDRLNHQKRMWSIMRKGHNTRRKLNQKVINMEMKTNKQLFSQIWGAI